MKGRAVVIRRRARSQPLSPAKVRLAEDASDSRTESEEQPAKRLKPSAGDALVGGKVSLGDRELQFARALSDSDKRVRDASLSSLTEWLGDNAEKMDDGSWDKLCKALFYCVWMSDKRAIISQVVRRVVGLAEVSGWPFLEALVRCIVREWHGVDRHRVDKFYELISVALGEMVSMTIRDGSDKAKYRHAIERFMRFLQTEVADKAACGSSGVALHIVDYWQDSVLKPLMVHANSVVSGNDIHGILDELVAVPCSALGARRSTLLALHKRCVKRVLARLPEVLADPELKLSAKQQRDMMRRTMKKVWAAAASGSTLEQCRPGLYDVHKSLKKAVAELEVQPGVVPAQPSSVTPKPNEAENPIPTGEAAPDV